MQFRIIWGLKLYQPQLRHWLGEEGPSCSFSNSILRYLGQWGNDSAGATERRALTQGSPPWPQPPDPYCLVSEQ